ncbi:MAG: CoA-binding protein, partial [Actinomycetota bacterium]|nr:CoA-binding protein [Actinomycetota bacterium]
FASIAVASRVHCPPDVVDVLIRTHRAGQFSDDALEFGNAPVLLQLNVVDAYAAQRVMDAGMLMVMDRCPAIDYPRLVT